MHALVLWSYTSDEMREWIISAVWNAVVHYFQFYYYYNQIEIFVKNCSDIGVAVYVLIILW